MAGFGPITTYRSSLAGFQVAVVKCFGCFTRLFPGKSHNLNFQFWPKFAVTSQRQPLSVRSFICTPNFIELVKYSLLLLINNLSAYLHFIDFMLFSIARNLQIGRADPLTWESKQLPFRPLLSLDDATPDDLYIHLQGMIQCLSGNS